MLTTVPKRLYISGVLGISRESAMFKAFAILQVIISVLMVTIILMQEGKKGMGAIFGGSSSSIFGARGAANILAKATTVLAILFFLNSIWLAHLSSSKKSIVDKETPEMSAPKTEEPAPVPAPAPAPAPAPSEQQ